MKIRNQFNIFVLFLFLASCEQLGETAGSTAPILTKPSRTETKVLKPTVTPTRTVTPPPTFTPSSGPPPDLELLDISIYPKTFDKRGQTYYLLGRTRNNTNGIMVFYGVKPIIRFTFEVWDYDSSYLMIHKNPYNHAKYIDEAGLETGGHWTINCVLYPGEEGIFNFFTESNRGGRGYISREDYAKYSGPLGIWYTYESFYNIQPDLPLNLHPTAENIKIKKHKATLEFEYDIMGIPPLDSKTQYSNLETWIILLDKNGKVINFLFKPLFEYPDYKWGATSVHIHGTDAGASRESVFYHTFEVTQEMVDALDHIEVMNEYLPNHLC
jgi:hypothetical protein